MIVLEKKKNWRKVAHTDPRTDSDSGRAWIRLTTLVQVKDDADVWVNVPGTEITSAQQVSLVDPATGGPASAELNNGISLFDYLSTEAGFKRLQNTCEAVLTAHGIITPFVAEP